MENKSFYFSIKSLLWLTFAYMSICCLLFHELLILNCSFPIPSSQNMTWTELVLVFLISSSHNEWILFTNITRTSEDPASVLYAVLIISAEKICPKLKRTGNGTGFLRVVSFSSLQFFSDILNKIGIISKLFWMILSIFSNYGVKNRNNWVLLLNNIWIPETIILHPHPKKYSVLCIN